MDDGLTVRFSSQVEGLEEIAPPAPAGKFTPDWMRSLSGSVESKSDESSLVRSFRTSSTVKRCSGILDTFRTGYVIPLWADFHVRYDSSRGEIDWSSPSPWARISHHPLEQFSDTPLAQLAAPYTVITKLESPWRIHLPKGYSTYFVDPVYHRDRSDFWVLPGIVDHDEFHVANIFVVWSRFGRGDVMLPRGMPLVQVLPFRRETMRVEVAFMSADDERKRRVEEVKMQGLRGYYRKFFRSKKDYR